VLDRGVGHLDGSALPGQAGNVVLAAHRDTFFRGLRDIHNGDTVNVTTQSGPRTYKVDSTEVVDPAQTSVLDPTAKPTLTLITCYPFYFIGHAPKRFIVRARDTNDRDPQETSARDSQQPAPAEQSVAQNPPQQPTQKKEVARSAPSQEQTPSQLTPEETANLTYVFKASQ
jgi:LPXTG-site transpeptidase (sortase) family protein